MIQTAIRDLFRKPSLFLTSFFILSVLVLVIPPSLFFLELPMDSMEALHWGAEGAWGNAKHPPFAGMLVWYFSSCFGLADWSVYLLGSVLQGMGFIFLYRLGCELFDPERALYAVLIPLFSTALTIEVPMYSVSTPHLALYPMAMYSFYKAVRTDKLPYWVAFGVSAGLGFLCKYVEVLLFAGMFVYLLCSAENRRTFRSFGLYLSGTIAFVIILPHLVWLYRNDFLPFSYAAEEMSEERYAFYVYILRGFGLTFLPFLIYLSPVFIISLIGSRSPRCLTCHPEQKDAFLYSFCLYALPVLSVFVLGVTGHTILTRWYYQLGIPAGLFIVSLMRKDFFTKSNGTLFRIIVLILFLILGGIQVHNLVTPEKPKGFTECGPLKEQVLAYWRSQPGSVTGGNLEPKVILGPKYYAPFVQNLLGYRCRASVDFDRSSCENNRELMRKNGILIVTAESDDTTIRYLEKYIGHSVRQTPRVEVKLIHPVRPGQLLSRRQSLFLSAVPPLDTQKP